MFLVPPSEDGNLFDISFIISSGENTRKVTKEMIKVFPISDHKLTYTV